MAGQKATHRRLEITEMKVTSAKQQTEKTEYVRIGGEE
jgi:hypothetical protein